MTIPFHEWPASHLTSVRLLLRPPVYDDGPALHTVMSDAEVCRYLPYPPSTSLAITRHVIALWVSSREEGLTTYAICLRKQPAEAIGILQARRQPGLLAVEVGVVLGQDHWGCGYALEAMRALRWSAPPEANFALRGGVDRENQKAVAMLSKTTMPNTLEIASRVHPNVSQDKRDCVVFERQLPADV